VRKKKLIWNPGGSDQRNKTRKPRRCRITYVRKERLEGKGSRGKRLGKTVPNVYATGNKKDCVCNQGKKPSAVRHTLRGYGRGTSRKRGYVTAKNFN